jgi:hypothetical protein
MAASLSSAQPANPRKQELTRAQLHRLVLVNIFIMILISSKVCAKALARTSPRVAKTCTSSVGASPSCGARLEAC